MSATAVLSRASFRGVAACLRSSSSGIRSAGIPRVSRSQMPCLPALSRFYASKQYPPHTVITMPALSPTMTAGNIGVWQKKPGDSISAGDVLVEIETDKAQMDFEYQEDGIFAKILRESGSKDVAVGNPIAILVEDSADIGAFADFSAESSGGESSTPSPPKKESSESSEPPRPAPTETGSEEPAPSGGRIETVLERTGRIVISPVAKQLALERGVAIKDIKGTGEGGRITKSDVEKAKPKSGGSAVSTAASTEVPITSMRKTIATRLTNSKNTNPHYYVSTSLSVGKLLRLRQVLNAEAGEKPKISINDFIIKAVGAALLRVPAVNSSYLEDEGVIRTYNTADISVAVATPTGLMTPIVRNVTGKGLLAISADVKALGAKAKDGKLKPEEYLGGTFTISNMGMNPAVDSFTAIINPPQAGILAVGTVKRVAIMGKDEAVEWDHQIIVTGSFDHRAVDGAVGGEFLRELKKIVEHPMELLL